MKHFAALLLFSCWALAQEVSPPAQIPNQEFPKVNDRPLSEVESLKLQVVQLKMTLLEKQYNLDSYRKELAPLQAEQLEVARAACRSIGIPEDKIQFGSPSNECSISWGMDADGKPLKDASGKPVMGHVWRAKPEGAK